MGHLIDWSEVEDYEALSGIAFHYPSDFPKLDPKPASKKWQRLVAPLAEGQGVQALHYFARPTKVTEQHLALLRDMPDTFELLVVDRWEPWSVIHVQRTKPLAEQRIHPSGGVGL